MLAKYRILGASFLGVAMLMLVGTARLSAQDPVEDGPTSDLPKAVQDTINKELGADPDIDKTDTGEDDGVVIYEIDGKNADGYDVDLDIAADGTVVGKKEKMAFESAPKAVQEAVKKALGGKEYDEIEAEKISEEGDVEYRVEVKINDVETEYKVTTGGEILKIEQELDENNLPAEALALLKKEIGENAMVEDAKMQTKGNDEPYYDLEGTIGTKEFDLEIKKDGTIVRKDIE